MPHHYRHRGDKIPSVIETVNTTTTTATTITNSTPPSYYPQQHEQIQQTPPKREEEEREQQQPKRIFYSRRRGSGSLGSDRMALSRASLATSCNYRSLGFVSALLLSLWLLCYSGYDSHHHRSGRLFVHSYVIGPSSRFSSPTLSKPPSWSVCFPSPVRPSSPRLCRREQELQKRRRQAPFCLASSKQHDDLDQKIIDMRTVRTRNGDVVATAIPHDHSISSPQPSMRDRLLLLWNSFVIRRRRPSMDHTTTTTTTTSDHRPPKGTTANLLRNRWSSMKRYLFPTHPSKTVHKILLTFALCFTIVMKSTTMMTTSSSFHANPVTTEISRNVKISAHPTTMMTTVTAPSFTESTAVDVSASTTSSSTAAVADNRHVKSLATRYIAVPAATTSANPFPIQKLTTNIASSSSTSLLFPRGGAGSVAKSFSSSNTLSDDNIMKQLEERMEERIGSASRETGRTIRDAIYDLHRYLQGPKSDTLLLLLATALVTPLCRRMKISPILGFLFSGMLLGPNGFGAISGIHTTETLAELGIVFFLFEMGIELSVQRLLSMKRDVFGLGLLQFLLTSGIIGLIGHYIAHLSPSSCVVLGGGIALSSSAFVLQILKDKNQLATRFGKASFGVLLFQDLAVVPLLVVTPLLAPATGGAGSSSLAAALGSAIVKATIALSSIAVCGRFILNPLFKIVAAAQSQEAFLGVVLLTVLSMSFLTEGLGLSNTLGAFLAGVLLSETRYRYQVEADIAPFRGILLGLFFVTVGFEIDLKLIASNLPLVSTLVFGILSIKAIITTLLSLGFGLSLSTSQQAGLILSQGGEFAFVAFGLARSLGILDASTTKLMLTSVSLTMACTPFMASIGSKITKKLEESSDFSHYLGQDRDAEEIKESTDGFTVVVGYGAVGRIVCDLLDRRFMKYVGLDVDPNKAIQARNMGLPIFYGDIGRQEVAEAFNVGKANAVVVCIADRAQANRVLIALRRWYPKIKIFARAVDADHASRLQNTLNVAAMVPILPEDNLLLTLPFGGAVMKALGVPTEEVNAILEAKRKEVLSGRGLDRNEEEAALLQLGIEKPKPMITTGMIKQSTKSTKAVSTSSSSSTSMSSQQNATMDSENGSSSSSSSTRMTLRVSKDGDDINKVDDAKWVRAATERRKEAEVKSPFVAQVIEEVCPGSAGDNDDEPCIPLPLLAKDTIIDSSSSSSSTNDDVSNINSATSSVDYTVKTTVPTKVTIDES